MTNILRTAEFNPDMSKWLDWFCYEQEISFSVALNQVLALGRQCIENNQLPGELPIAQKLLIQTSMESLLLLQEAVSQDQRKVIRERAKTLIRKTLALEVETECLPS
ncbi:hypothetical protein [Candidatus Berkiella aquae]|uniref:Uncharacterized protein n=1 Tax=Candidatus Berkiella aquae TaxID=295108 RepID=A0A0Q9YKF6_9GAMM|nr:hypothetical protein [Candidatus Berkiella aquae]MCS5712808.1 hypothetical protein [Candidatus Berkiella aquae]